MSTIPVTIRRCQHIKVNGIQCGSPAMRNERFCFFHEECRVACRDINMRFKEHGIIKLPTLEDANSIQLGLGEVMRLLVTQQIDYRIATLLLRALRIAAANVKFTSLEPQPTRIVIDPKCVGNRPLGATAWSAVEGREYDFIGENEIRENEPAPSTTHPPAIASKEPNQSSETGINESQIKQPEITDLIQVDQGEEDSNKRSETGSETRSEKTAAKEAENNQDKSKNEDTYKHERPEFNRDLLRRIDSRPANLLAPACATSPQLSTCHPERSEGPMQLALLNSRPVIDSRPVILSEAKDLCNLHSSPRLK